MKDTALGVELVHWNPLRAPRGMPELTRLLGVGGRLDNFGDLLGPVVVREILGTRPTLGGPSRLGRRLLSVGSILHFGRLGDVVWGSGINGKQRFENSLAPLRALDIRAVRGPLTRDLLLARGADCPAVYGDPALLLPIFLPLAAVRARLRPRGLAIVPNFNDWPTFAGHPAAVNPCAPWRDVVSAIVNSELVVGSSLHGIIVAEAYGIPARAIAAGDEAPWKYKDYFLGTGRSGYEPAQDVDQAVELGPEAPPAWDPQPLRDAFPWDLWTAADEE